MCRKDIKGVIGKQTILDFFSDPNSHVYIDLYQLLDGFSGSPMIKYVFELSFGDYSEIERVLGELLKKCVLLVQAICSQEEASVKKEL